MTTAGPPRPARHVWLPDLAILAFPAVGLPGRTIVTNAVEDVCITSSAPVTNISITSHWRNSAIAQGYTSGRDGADHSSNWSSLETWDDDPNPQPGIWSPLMTLGTLVPAPGTTVLVR